MRIHLRVDSTNEQHVHTTIFIDGQNTGSLCMSPAQHDWFYLTLEKGVSYLSKDDDTIFVGSGHTHGTEETEFPLPMPRH